MTKKVKQNLTLPENVSDTFDAILDKPVEVRDAYMRLLRDAGWTLQSIADAEGTLTRERVRQCVAEMSRRRASSIVNKYATTRLKFSIPEPPDKPEKPKSERVIVMPKPDTLKKLRELKPKAAQVRYSHKQYRKEAEEYVSLLWKAHTEEGVSVYRLAKLLDTIPAGIQTRFVRYGYKETKGTSNNYDPIKYRKSVT